MQWTTLITGRYMITMMMLLCYVNMSGGQFCTDYVNVHQNGHDHIGRNTLAIIPHLSFTCDGRITGIRARVAFDDNPNRNNYPFFQVWRPTGSRNYIKIDEIQLQSDDQVTGSGTYRTANIILTDNNTIEFQSRDVVGYYHPSNSRYQVRTIRTDGYILYQFTGSRESVNLNNGNDDRQPLIQFTIAGQSCADMVNVQQQGNNQVNDNSQVLVPRSIFYCTGRLAGYLISLNQDHIGGDFPHIEIWHPVTSRSTTTYILISEYILTEDDIVEMNNYYFANVSFAVNETIQLQPGDVIGYYQPANPRYTVWSVDTAGYISYTVSTETFQTIIYASRVLDTINDRQPLIQVLYDIQCRDKLSSPANGEIMSCSSGRIGVGYEGDTCNFTCNTGYELTGSDTRTCQSDGSWSGSDDVCRRVQCPTPMNGNLQCPNGATNGVFEDTCTFSCNAGYELQGSNSRICLANQSWSGRNPICVALNCSTSPPLNTLNNSQLQSSCDTQYQSTCSTVCVDGYTGVGGSYTCLVTDEDTNNVGWSGSTSCQRVNCSMLNSLMNGTISCSLGDDGVPSYEDTCSFTCNTGYELTGSDTRTCQGDGSWSGSDTICKRECSASLNGHVDCGSGLVNMGLEGDNCTFLCDPGYMSQGSVTSGTCENTGHWSERLPSCVPLNCNNNNLMNISFRASSCRLQYQSQCTVSCDEGFTGDDVTYLCNVTSDPTMVDWVPIGGVDVMCERVLCVNLSDPENGNVTCPSNTTVFQDTCTYYCNRGYQLEGNRQTRCNADGTWSSEPVTCTILKCNDPEVEIANSQSVGVCNVTYGSSCSLNCSNNFSVSGNGEHVCDVNDEGTSVKWRSVGGAFSCVAAETLSNSDSGNGLPVPIIAGTTGGAVLSLIILFCVVFLYYKWRSRKKKAYSISTVYAQTDPPSAYREGHKEADTFAVANTLYSSVEAPSNSKKDHRAPGAETATSEHDYPYYYTVEQAVSNMEEVYTYAKHHNDGDQMEDEQKIYETPCEDDGDYGPIYIEPPTTVEKIYETFEGKRFRKLYHQNIRTLEELGSGEFGVVTRGLLSSATGDVEMAVKTLNSNASAKDKLRFLQEAAIMCQFDHQNVIKLHGVVMETPAMIVLEYVSHGDLKQFLMNLQPLSQERVHAKLPLLLLKFCMEISAGMAYLSGKQFVHRDLAARNVLVSEKCVCKIADFGMSRDLIDDNYYITSGGKIPVKWTAPEAIHYRKYSVQSDVWSYGCVLYEIWSLGYKPFEELTNIEVLEKINSGYRLPPPPGCPKAIYRMMMKCWHPDPRSRPQFGQITKLLTGNSGYLLGWSDEDKQIGGEDATKLRAPLESAYNLYSELQQAYKRKK